METSFSWQEVLTEPHEGCHIAQIYQDPEFLTKSAVSFIGAALHKDQGVAVIATPSNWRKFLDAFKDENYDIEYYLAHDQIAFRDARSVLSEIMVHGMPDWDRFQSVITDFFKPLQENFPSIRAYGEMVNLLWLDGNLKAAMRLEEFWNKLSRINNFSLFCAYQMDNLDCAVYAGAMQGIGKTHTHLIPAKDYAKFEEAVSTASEETLGQSLSNMLRFVADKSRLRAQMPTAQAALFWLQENMPLTALRILSKINSKAKRKPVCEEPL